jgi:hypothetical protein
MELDRRETNLKTVYDIPVECDWSSPVEAMRRTSARNLLMALSLHATQYGLDPRPLFELLGPPEVLSGSADHSGLLQNRTETEERGPEEFIFSLCNGSLFAHPSCSPQLVSAEDPLEL